MSHNGYQFAELARGESLQSPSVCDCCGREGLKKTVKLVNPEGRIVWFGVGCAAKAMSCPEKLVRKAREAAIDAETTRERAERDREWRERDAQWQAFLDASGPEFVRNRLRQIEALGGYAKARARFLAECGARNP